MRPGQLMLILIFLIIPVEAQPNLSTTLGIEAVRISDNEYWIETNSLISIVDVGMVFTGLTSFDVNNFPQDLMGDLFILIDGVPERVTAIEGGKIKLALTKGYHSIISLYMGKGNGGFEHSSDTIYVDLSSSYSRPDLTAYDFTYLVNDTVKVGELIDHTIRSTDFSYPVRDLDLDAGITASISLEGSNLNAILELNSFGSASLQTDSQFAATRGNVFFTDDLGIHRDPTQLYFEDEINLGVLVVHEAGVMLGEDFDGIMIGNAAGSFDFHIEYLSFEYTEPTDETTPVTDPTDDPNEATTSTPEYTPVISSRETTFTNNEPAPVPIVPFLITLIILRRKK